MAATGIPGGEKPYFCAAGSTDGHPFPSHAFTKHSTFSQSIRGLPFFSASLRKKDLRSVPITRFFRGFYETTLEPGEIVTAVRIPAPPLGARSGYIKFTPRSAEDKPLVGVAALIALDAAGRCAEARIGLGGAAPTPIRAHRAEMALRGQALSDAAIRAAAETAAREAEPLSDLMGSADYRREMIRVWVRRLLVALRDGTQRAG